MSEKRYKLEIYSLDQFQKADRIDRIRMNIIEPDRFVLTDADWQYAKDLEHAWLLVSSETREAVAINLIRNSVPGAESWYKANRILRDVEALYAPFLSRNREMQRARVIERMYHFAELAQKRAVFTDDDGNECIDQEWLLIAQKFLKEAAEMEGLDATNALPFNPDDLVIPEFEITSDPEAFLEEQTGEYDDYLPEEGEEDEDA